MAGRPLLAYSLVSATDSGMFSGIYVIGDASDTTARLVASAQHVHWLSRPPETSTDEAPDILWVRFALDRLPSRADRFAILRPTSPFRSASTIQRAYRQFTQPDQTADSLRAIEPVRQHPGKMWTWDGPGYPLRPLLQGRTVHGARIEGTPQHSRPTQTLERVYVQNSSLEMAWTRCVDVDGTISGRKIAPFFTEGYEGFAIDDPDDWDRAEELIRRGLVRLPGLATEMPNPIQDHSQIHG